MTGDFSMQTKHGITAFFTKDDVFSNWYMRDFTVKGITFNCVEQAMMYAKAKLFGDDAVARQILLTKEPKDQKAFGKKVANFNEQTWVDNRVRIVSAILFHKFNQHADLKKALLDTRGTELVEASPYDKIWGIGMGVNDKNFLDRSRWGLNLLGECLTIVREHLLKLERNPTPTGPSPSI
jgi:ribA/ribD-fused uncharacterized protein